MNTNIRTPLAMSIASLVVATSAVLPASAANQDDFFWKELQRTDGVSLSEALPRAKATAGIETRPVVAKQDWFEIERQRSDGYRDEASAPAEAHAMDRRAQADRGATK